MSFHVSDVFLPDTRELSSIWSEASEVEGTIVDFSDSGNTSRVFAVVEVVQRQTVVVPIEKLKSKESAAQHHM